jgi:large subunit ribosomal protein L28
MAKRCEICGKTPKVGRILSHAHNVRPRRFEPNLQTVRALVNGGHRRVTACTRCIRSNKIAKVA